MIKGYIYVLFINLSLMAVLCYSVHLGQDHHQSKIQTQRSSLSGAGEAPQTCPSGYYCPNDQECKYPRSDRCTSNQDCEGLGMCYSSECSTGKYSIYLGHANLLSKKRNIAEHQFVVYRGYAYEYGNSYNQELDIADPQYKYADGAHLNSDGLQLMGCSSCSYDDAGAFADGWDIREYSVWNNNCKDFAKLMVKFLTTGSCNEQSSSERKEGNTNSTSLVSEINAILDEAACSGAAAPTFSALVLIVTVITFYSLFYMLQ